jgi:hypothetical protein
VAEVQFYVVEPQSPVLARHMLLLSLLLAEDGQDISLQGIAYCSNLSAYSC